MGFLIKVDTLKPISLPPKKLAICYYSNCISLFFVAIFKWRLYSCIYHCTKTQLKLAKYRAEWIHEIVFNFGFDGG